MLIGYILLRDSYRFQGVEPTNILALEALIRAGCELIYLDFWDEEKTQLHLLLSELKTNDILIVPRSKILGSSRASFLQRIQLLQYKGVHLQSIEDNYFLPSSLSLSERLNLTTKFFPVAELNRSNCQPITLIPRPQTSQKDCGRPPLPKEQKELIRLLRLLRINQLQNHQKPITVLRLCRLARICKQTYYNLFPSSQKSA